MPNLTRLERAQDICWSKWQSPRQFTKIELRQVDMPADRSPFKFSLDGSTISLREVTPTMKTKGGRFFLEVSLYQRTIQIPRIIEPGPDDEEGEIVFDNLTPESALITVTGVVGFISEVESEEIYRLIPERLYGENGQLIAPYTASKGYEDPKAEQEVSPFLLTPITPEEIAGWLNGVNPPRPAEVPSDWVHKESRLERMFTNGQQAIGPNEIGDISAYDAGGVKAPEQYVAVIQEPGDDPVTVMVGSVTKDGSGRVSSGRGTEANNPAKDGTVPTYRIINDVATKVGER